MPQTIIEKILSDKAGRAVSAGDLAWINLDVRTARDFGGANVVQAFEEAYPGETVQHRQNIYFTFDCQAPANTIPYANNQQTCRRFAAKHGIKVFDVDRGIGTHTLFEEGLIAPGMVAVGTDSHYNLLGAFGALGQGMGDQDIAYTFRTGRTWFEVPATVHISLSGRTPPENTEVKDLALFLLGQLKTETALGQAVEITGEEINALPFSARITLASLATEMGAIAILLPPPEKLLHFLASRVGRPLPPAPHADAKADYSAKLHFDVSRLTPQISTPPAPHHVRPVSELAGKKIDSVFLGSCTNGRYEDFHRAAVLLAGKKIHPNVIMRAVPATREVYSRILESGDLAVLHRAGVIVSHAGCGGCASGQLGMTGQGEVQLSTSNRNFTGKQGAGDTYLCGVRTAVLSAIKGEITDHE